MTPLLTEVEVRVLGSLIEKEITTPDYYPLSMNALLAACNQKSNRDPVMEFDEDTVRQALHGLDDKRLAGAARGTESRVTKYEHRFSEVFNLGRREVAVLCVLLLRGPQTVGEIRGRSERLYDFAELSDVQSTLQRLIDSDQPMVRVLPRAPGTKEVRYIHLFCGDVQIPSSATTGQSDRSFAQNDGQTNEHLQANIEALADRVSNLQREVDELRARLDSLTG
jgi:uncharacterized protein